MSIQCPTCLTENPAGNLNCFACGSPLVMEEASYHLPAGTILTSPQNQYRIEKTIGVGGFGITYQGIDLNNSQIVAIKENWPEKGIRQGVKIIWPSSIAPQDKKEQIKKVIQEAQYIQDLNHPHIVQVYDRFVANNTAYIVMEFLSGQSLEDLRQKQGKLPEAQIKKYLIQIAQALKLIHQENLLHRDIKPGNIMIVPPERAVLIDFGNAREFIADTTQRMTQILSPGYAPLEQYSSRGRRGPEMDIYSLCASMYELLTGKLPPSPIDRYPTDILIPPRQIISTISPLTEKVILTGMNMRVEDRFASADDLINALQGKWISPTLKRARELVDQQQLPAAIQAYQKCLEDINQEAAAVELAMVLMHVDDSQAATAAQEAIQINSNDGRGYGVLGLVYCRQGKWLEAHKNLEIASNLTPNESWIQANYAWALGKLKDWQPAAITIKRAIQLDSESTFALGLQAWIAANQHQWKPAIRYSRQAIFKSKQSPPDLEVLSWIYPCLTIALDKAVITKQAPDVERCLQQYITDVPYSGIPFGFQGWKQASKGLFPEALLNLQQAVKKQEVPNWIWLNQGIVCENLRNIRQAIAIYNTYLQKCDRNPLVLFRLGTLSAKLDQWAEARSYLEETMKLKSDYAEAHHNLAWVLLQIKDGDGEVKHPRECLAAYKRAVELYEQQGKNHLKNQIVRAFHEAEIDL